MEMHESQSVQRWLTQRRRSCIW